MKQLDIYSFHIVYFADDSYKKYFNTDNNEIKELIQIANKFEKLKFEFVSDVNDLADKKLEEYKTNPEFREKYKNTWNLDLMINRILEDEAIDEVSQMDKYIVSEEKYPVLFKYDKLLRNSVKSFDSFYNFLKYLLKDEYINNISKLSDDDLDKIINILDFVYHHKISFEDKQKINSYFRKLTNKDIFIITNRKLGFPKGVRFVSGNIDESNPNNIETDVNNEK